MWVRGSGGHGHSIVMNRRHERRGGGGGRGSHGKNARSKPLFPNITHIERSSRLLYFAGLLRDFDHVCFFTRFKHAGKKTRSKTSLYNTKPDGWNHLN